MTARLAAATMHTTHCLHLLVDDDYLKKLTATVQFYQPSNRRPKKGCVTAYASSSTVGEAGTSAASIRALCPEKYSPTAQLYSPLSPVAITPSRSSFL